MKKGINFRKCVEEEVSFHNKIIILNNRITPPLQINGTGKGSQLRSSDEKILLMVHSTDGTCLIFIEMSWFSLTSASKLNIQINRCLNKQEKLQKRVQHPNDVFVLTPYIAKEFYCCG